MTEASEKLAAALTLLRVSSELTISQSNLGVGSCVYNSAVGGFCTPCDLLGILCDRCTSLRRFRVHPMRTVVLPDSATAVTGPAWVPVVGPPAMLAEEAGKASLGCHLCFFRACSDYALHLSVPLAVVSNAVEKKTDERVTIAAAPLLSIERKPGLKWAYGGPGAESLVNLLAGGGEELLGKIKEPVVRRAQMCCCLCQWCVCSRPHLVIEARDGTELYKIITRGFWLDDPYDDLVITTMGNTQVLFF